MGSDQTFTVCHDVLASSIDKLLSGYLHLLYRLLPWLCDVTVDQGREVLAIIARDKWQICLDFV